MGHVEDQPLISFKLYTIFYWKKVMPDKVGMQGTGLSPN